MRGLRVLAHCHRHGLGNLKIDFAESARCHEKAHRCSSSSGGGGCPASLVDLAWLLQRGGFGLAKDPARAIHCLTVAACHETNFEQASFRLGQCFLHGAGTDRDPIRARTWFAKAAQAGHARSLHALGDMFAVRLRLFLPPQ